MKLDANDRALLEELNEDGGTYQINTWALKAGDPFRRGAQLQSLKRRGLIDAEGRTTSRQWWITDAGKAALEEEA